MDRNNDGMLSPREWHAEPGAFAATDRNDDGLVTLREFLNGAADDQRQRFSTMDRNRDGFLSRASSILSWAFSPAGGVLLTMKETAASIFDQSQWALPPHPDP